MINNKNVRSRTRTSEGKLETSLFRKVTHTDQILNYNGNHSSCHEMSCVEASFKRVNTYCSNEDSKQKEIKISIKLLNAIVTQWISSDDAYLHHVNTKHLKNGSSYISLKLPAWWTRQSSGDIRLDEVCNGSVVLLNCLVVGQFFGVLRFSSFGMDDRTTARRQK